MSKVQKLLKNWPLHLAMLVIVVVFEGINTITIPTPIGGISLLPMLFAMVAGLVLFLLKPLTFIKEEQSHLGGDFVMIGIGFLLAIVLFASVRERLEFSDPPKAFQGFPIALVTAGLMALSFMGFQGLQIPW